MSLKSLRSRLASPKNSFAKSVGVLLSGTVGAQLLSLVAAPFLTRMYSAAHFGELAVYVALIGVLAIVASLRLEMAVPLPEQDEKARALVAAGLGFAALVSAVVALGVFAFEVQIWSAQSLWSSMGPVYAIAPGIFLTAAFQLFRYWEIRKNRFRTISRALVIANVVAIACQLFVPGLDAEVLIYGFLMGRALAVLSLFLACRSELSLASVRRETIREVCARYQKFPKLTTLEGLVNALGTQFTPIVISGVVGQGPAGVFSLAQRYSVAPVGLIANSITQVFVRDGTNAKREGSLHDLSWKIFRTVSRLTSGAAIISVVCAPEAFSMILGNAWRESGYIAQCFSPWLYALVISSSLAGLITVCERQSMGLKFQTVLSILRFAALSLGLYYGTLTQAIMCYSLVSAACWLALATKLLTDLGISGRAIFQLQLRCLARGLLFAAPALFYKCFANPSDLWVCISCAASLAGYWLWVYGLKHGSRSD